MTAAGPPPLREQIGRLLLNLRGDVSRSAVARRLGISRQSVMKLEEGSVSVDRLDALGELYGVQFQIVAVDPRGFTWNSGGTAGCPSVGMMDGWTRCAPGLVEELAPPAAAG